MTAADGVGVGVGVEDIGAYFGTASVEVADLFAARGLDRSRLPNLMMRRKSVALPCEDVVSYAVNAARPVLERLGEEGRAEVETLVVATESGVDLAKSAAAFAHGFLDLPRTCRLFEVKQACHGGVAALQVVAATLAADPRRRGKALVIAGDLPRPARHSYAEPSQGAGAIAVLLGEPRLAAWHPGRHGSHSFANTDFARPAADVDVIDVDLSIMSYVDCLLESYSDYARKEGSDFRSSFGALAMHTPFPGMVRGAHRTAARRLAGLGRDEADDDFRRRVEASVLVPREVGNIYSGCALMAAASSLRHHSTPTGHELGLYSYGGGCSSEFVGLTAAGDTALAPFAGQLDDALAARVPIPVDRYDAVLDRAGSTVLGARTVDAGIDAHADLIAGARRAGPLLMLDSIDDHRRTYRWCGRDAP
ncbi:hydroxymethylglutaryl-CoA synthase family protein [Saccharothrix algeriensis]|uniref:Hydroxymethylglutaryl-CoA synthase family protein n=1 Tax=Saccharothrix algeriensis TaxID=173560 RepID=A0A8T8HZV2_9PSEU|nr:hydroxymethylglutaryl-CoA synthase family protein [Saccharothrix algeriensis]MBM7809853.1 polyketide biosynthesis 3-hydroxy-3-methylglutaryl-CoA synthase-like enzyme PksG [Saccharothrix algeriensis]QTR04115.1 hydroxymethylglutaryl-CoA synthase family protein [Saccharothrix algeriensis]